MRSVVRFDQVANRTTEWGQVPQSGVLEGMEGSKPSDALGKVAETTVPVNDGSVPGTVESARRCLWDLPVFAGRGWPEPTCGGPRSCNGSCSRVALSSVQSWLGTLQGQPYVTAFGRQLSGPPIGYLKPGPVWHASAAPLAGWQRSEERRVGKECRSR